MSYSAGQRGDLLRIRAQGQGEVLQKDADAQRRDDGRDAGRLAQRLVGQRSISTPRKATPTMESSSVGTKGSLRKYGGNETEEGAHHEQIAVGEIDHGQHAVDHGVAQGDEGVDAAQLQGVEYLLEEVRHSVT